jgi:predicted aminopeptidase
MAGLIPNRPAISALLLVAGLCTGCRTLEFYSQAVSGQVGVLAKRRPVEEIMEETDDAELRTRLVLTQRLLDFARDELEMPSGGSYELYADIGRDHLVWVVYAAPELSLEPKDWWYPVVGRQEYRGYFREDLARAETGRLEAQGYETWTQEVDAFSTLGWFRDPVLNTFVHRDEIGFAELIFHELAHRKYYVRGNTSFNEGMAEAVAREGVRRWFRASGRADMARKYEKRLQRLGQARDAIGGAAERLDDLYQSTLPDDVKRERKLAEMDRLKRRLRELRGDWGGGLKSWIEDPVNNARLNSFTTYETEVRRFVELLDQCGGDLGKFWQQVEELKPAKWKGD